MLGLLFTLPSASDMLSGIGSTTTPVLSDFMPVIYLVGGIFLAVGIVLLLIRAFVPHH